MSLDADVRRLASTPPLGALDRGALRLVAFSGERISLADGELLFRQGDAADAAYQVVSGALALEIEGSTIPPFLAGPDALVGETALFAALQRPSSARARGATEVTKFPRAIMRRVLEEFPEEAAKLRAALAATLGEFGAALEASRRRARATSPDL